MAIDVTRVPAGLEFLTRSFRRLPPAVSVTQRSGRYEDRVLDQPWQPLQVTGDAYSFTYAAAKRIDDFFVARSGQMFAFLFRHCHDDIAASALLGLGDDATTVFDLVREYTDPDATRTYRHPILFPEAGTLSVTVAGASAAFTDLGGGQVQLAAAPAAGAEVRASFRFDVPMRLATEWPGWTHGVDGYRATGLELVEVRD